MSDAYPYCCGYHKNGGEGFVGCYEPRTDPRDAEIAAQRAEIKRMCEDRDSAQRCIEKLTEIVRSVAAALAGVGS